MPGRRRLALVVVAVATWLAAAPAGVGAQDSIVVVGRVEDAASKNPVVDADVTIGRRVPGDEPVLVGSATTDAAGAYAIRVPHGKYVLRADAVGYEEADRNILAVAGDSAFVPSLRLRNLGEQPHEPPKLFTSRFFEPFEPNYFLFGHQFQDDPDDPGGYLNQVKFRVAVRYGLLRLERLSYETGLYAVYVQDSYWNLYQESSPFFDNNYSPGLLFYLDTRDLRSRPVPWWEPSYRAFVRHQSNGRDGEASRSWNRAGAGIEIGDASSILRHASLSVWGAFGIDRKGNADILDTNGHGELRVDLQPSVGSNLGFADLGLSVRSRILGTRVFQNVEVNLYLRPNFDAPVFRLMPSLAIQGFCGTGQALLVHRRGDCDLRVGFAVIE